MNKEPKKEEQLLYMHSLVTLSSCPSHVRQFKNSYRAAFWKLQEILYD